MAELEKMRRTAQRIIPGAPHETLLVMDATTGQNGLQQARLFTESAGVTGIVLTKLDGTAKGGVVVAISRELGLPVRLCRSRRKSRATCFRSTRRNLLTHCSNRDCLSPRRHRGNRAVSSMIGFFDLLTTSLLFPALLAWSIAQANCSLHLHLVVFLRVAVSPREWIQCPTIPPTTSLLRQALDLARQGIGLASPNPLSVR